MVNDEKLRRLQMLEDSINAQKYEMISDKLKSDYPQLFDGTFGVLQLTNKEKNINTVISLDRENPCLGNFIIYNKHVWNYIVNVLYLEKPKSIHLDSDLLSSTFKPIEFAEDFYLKIDDLYNDEEYMSLCDEILDLQKFSFNKPPETDFEQDNMFIVRFPESIGISEWTVRSCQRPSFSVIRSDVTGKVMGCKWHPIRMTLINPIGYGNNAKLMKWIKNHMDYVLNLSSYDDLHDITIEMVDKTGVPVEKWILKNCFVLSANFGTCNYDKNRMSKTTLCIQPGECKMVDLHNS